MESGKDSMAEVLSHIKSLEGIILGRMSTLEENMCTLTKRVNESILTRNGENGPPPLQKQKSLASSIFDKVNDESGVCSSLVSPKVGEKSRGGGGGGGGWVKLFCHKRGESFLFNVATKQVVWEAQVLNSKTKHGDYWERVSYCDENGELKWIFLDPSSGSVEKEEPLTEESMSHPKFNPGEFDHQVMKAKSESQPPLCQESSQQQGGSIAFPSTLTRKSVPMLDGLKIIKRQTSTAKHMEKKTSEDNIGNEPWNYMFDPHDWKRMSWDFLFILPCLIYLTVMMPYRLCFGHDAKGGMLVLETVMDMIFILDIFINFRTGYLNVDMGTVEYDWQKVGIRYLKSWFLLDMISGIPFALFDNVEELSTLSVVKILKMGRVAKAARLISFLKLTKVVKTTKILSSNHEEAVERVEDVLTDITTRSALSMIKIFIVIGLVVHFMACLWVLIGRMGDIDGKDNWLNNDIYTTDGQGFTYRDTEGGKKTSSVYIAAYFFCYTTITSVGYGDIHPYNDNERVYCVAMEMLGGFMYAVIIAALTSIATSTDTNKRAVRERLDMVASYVNSKQFPDHLSRRIKRYFRHFFESKTAIDEQRILTDLPTALRHEVSTFLISDLMNSVTLFKDLGPVSWSRILPLLRPVRFEAGDLVCSQGEPCSEAFILLEGECRSVTVVDPDFKAEKAVELSKAHQHYLIQSHKMGSNISDMSSTPSHAKGGREMLENSLPPIGQSDLVAGEGPDHTHVREIRNSIGGRGGHKLTTRFKFRKISDEDPLALRALTLFEQVDNAHFRILEMGSVINVLCLLHVWGKCLETVVCTEEAECYAINASEFRSIFNKDDDDFKEMKEKTVLTSFATFEMDEFNKDNGMEFGVPLYMYQKAEIEFRTEAYYKWKEAKKEKFAQALRKHEAEKNLAHTVKTTNTLHRLGRIISNKLQRKSAEGNMKNNQGRVYPDSNKSEVSSSNPPSPKSPGFMKSMEMTGESSSPKTVPFTISSNEASAGGRGENSRSIITATTNKSSLEPSSMSKQDNGNKAFTQRFEPLSSKKKADNFPKNYRGRVRSRSDGDIGSNSKRRPSADLSAPFPFAALKQRQEIREQKAAEQKTED